MPLESHSILDGKVHLYRRERSRFWQCSVFLGGRNHRKSTKQDKLVLAIEFAEDWYMDRYADERLRRRGIPLPGKAGDPVQAPPRIETPSKKPRRDPSEKTFRQAAEAFVVEFEILTRGERNPQYIAQKSQELRLHLLPFLGDRPLSEVTSGLVQDYRVHRNTPPPETSFKPTYKLRGRARLRKVRPWKRPSRSTLHKEIVCLRQVLKTAMRKGWLSALPDLSAPYKSSGKVTHRAWFSPEEYKRLYQATRERAKNPKSERWRPECEKLHDYVLFMVNTGLRPDECSRLEDRDVSIVADEATGERILEIEVRGKRGVGYCKSMPGAVLPYQRQRRRANLKPTDLVFGEVQRELFNTILEELGLKTDRDGKVRTAYSLRHTYICLRLMEGADIYQVAKNCRTSVEMIETYYAAHIKNTLDAAAINVRRPSRPRATRPAARAPANA